MYRFLCSSISPLARRPSRLTRITLGSRPSNLSGSPRLALRASSIGLLLTVLCLSVPASGLLPPDQYSGASKARDPCARGLQGLYPFGDNTSDYSFGACEPCQVGSLAMPLFSVFGSQFSCVVREMGMCRFEESKPAPPASHSSVYVGNKGVLFLGKNSWPFYAISSFPILGSPLIAPLCVGSSYAHRSSYAHPCPSDASLRPFTQLV